LLQACPASTNHGVSSNTPASRHQQHPNTAQYTDLH
jgi:hypothetical protein